MTSIKNPHSKSSPSAASFHKYAKIYEINGPHPLQKNVPEALISYFARKRMKGQVVYFNFELAEEMGLIAQDHPHQMNEQLTTALLDTFSLQIINEYDLENKTKIKAEDRLPHPYMATRYLQMQHSNKQGKTSGDGRSIWNGVVKHRRKIWDISSCGTGATCLSPATTKYNKFFKSGDPSISYGCGFSEIDEGLATLFMSEVFHKNAIKTERILALIEFKKGLSINIRAHENLLRPSHIFRFLKQNNLQGLKEIVDYYIHRQIAGHLWKDAPKNAHSKYTYFLNKMVHVFAELAGQFESEYIFCWLDWDGDNILMDGSIIDYGSVRQFGLFHEEYRYDDDDRFSTSIKEQKAKAKYIVKTFIQIVDYLTTGQKKKITEFNGHRALSEFDKIFKATKIKYLLKKIGFSHNNILFLSKKHLKEVKNFQSHFTYFERVKSLRGMVKVPDGINWNAIFCMGDILREMPQLLLMRGKKITVNEFIDIIKSHYAEKKDLEMTPYRRRKVSAFQKSYLKLINLAAQHEDKADEKILLAVAMRAGIVNRFDRVTGDSITKVVDKIKKLRPRMSPDHLADLVIEFREYQHLSSMDKKRDKCIKTPRQKKVFFEILKILRDYRAGL